MGVSAEILFRSLPIRKKILINVNRAVCCQRHPLQFSAELQELKNPHVCFLYALGNNGSGENGTGVREKREIVQHLRWMGARQLEYILHLSFAGCNMRARRVRGGLRRTRKPLPQGAFLVRLSVSGKQRATSAAAAQWNFATTKIHALKRCIE